MSQIQPSSPQASRRMARVRQKGTAPEVALRQELYRSGLRYRVNFEALKKPRRVADLAFPGLRIAVFVDGCFWHGCPQHATWPKQNTEFWKQKIEANRHRDADTNVRLRDGGWTVLRIWEHEPPIEASKAVAQLVTAARARLRATVTNSHKKT